MSNILYIEDDKAIAGLFKAIVEQQGHAVEIAHTGTDGLAMQAASPYDAIAVDYQLPDMTGIDICRKLLLVDPDIPIVMITGMGDQRLANEALGLGVMNYVQKDTDQVFLELLPSIIVQLLRKGAFRKERARMKAELERHHARMEDASRIAKLGFWEWDEQTQRITYMSREEISLLGYTPETVPDILYTSEGDRLCVHPDDLENYQKVAYGVADSGSDSYELDYRMIRSDGDIRHIRQAGRVERDSEGIAVTIFGVDQDVTEQKLSEKALRESEELHRTLFEQSPLGIVIEDLSPLKVVIDRLREEGIKDLHAYFLDHPEVFKTAIAETRTLTANETMLRLFGVGSISEYTEVVDEVSDWWNDQWAAYLIGKMLGLLENGISEPTEYSERRLDGSAFEVRSISHVLRGYEDTWGRVVITHENITEQAVAQRKLASSEARLRAFFQHSPYEVYMKDAEGRYQMANARFLEAHDITEEDLIGKEPKDIYPAKEAESARRHDLRVIKTGEPETSEEIAQRTDGTQHLLTVKFPILDEQGDITGVGAVGADISIQKKVEKALRESEERFRDFSEVGNDWHWELDEDLCYIILSPSGNNTELYPSGRYMGQSRAAVKPEGMDDDMWQAHIDDLEAHRPFRNFVQPRHLSDGTSIWLSVSGKPLFAPDGSFRGYRGTAIDVSQQKRSEDALLSAQRLAKVGSWRYVLDQDMVTNCSEEVAKLHGYSLVEFLELFSKEGKGYRSLVHPDDADRHYKTLGDAVANKENWESEFRIIRKDGEIRHLKEYGVVEVDVDGNVNCMTGSLQDITEEKWAAAELEQAREAAEAANRAKSDFLSSMSHELRTPLNAILGFAQLMEYSPQEPLTEAQQSSVDHIKKGGDHLLSLINDVLDLARIESGKTELSIEDIPLIESINECMTLVQSMADQRDIKISIQKKLHEPYIVRADSTRLTQVILNLLSNAIKYNRRAGRVTIDLNDADDNYLRIGITDTGPGIPDEKYAELFQPFSRLGAETTETEGTGIGLVVTKELVELMNGRIGFESALGVGSTFWIELPKSIATFFVDSMAADDIEDTKRKAFPSISGKILYVEDNPANLALMEQIIASIDGLSIISAHNAEFGIELAKSQKPDLIIFDINLPGMSGLEAIRALKKIDAVATIPIIALSAAATQKDISKGLEAGFDYYLTKPINVMEITETMMNILMPLCDQAK